MAENDGMEIARCLEGSSIKDGFNVLAWYWVCIFVGFGFGMNFGVGKMCPVPSIIFFACE